MAELRYSYALGPGDSIIYISNAIKGEYYKCPFCDAPLIIKEGKIKAKHFSHRAGSTSCTYESYLHSLAKRRIAEWFNSERVFEISILTKRRCEKFDNCLWQHDEYTSSYFCEEESFRKFSIKQYYDEITPEIMYKGFRADLLLSSRNTAYEPVFIEICINHPCEQQKIDSGIRIIEINLQTERELDSIVQAGILQEHIGQVSFYNFQRIAEQKITEGMKLNKFILLKSMNGFCVTNQVDCRSYIQRHPSAIFEITYDYLASKTYVHPFIFGWTMAYKYNSNARNCFLCKYHKQNGLYAQWLCCLYKKLNIDKHCKSNQAINCQAFSVDLTILNENYSSLPKISYNIWNSGMDNWGVDYQIEEGSF